MIMNDVEEVIIPQSEEDRAGEILIKLTNFKVNDSE
jgi:hypothetical protein